MSFTCSKTASKHGTYLLDDTVDDRILAVCKALWPKHSQMSCEPEKGYDEEWVFVANRNGQVFTVYSRWGVARIGGVRGGVSPKTLEKWLLKKVFKASEKLAA